MNEYLLSQQGPNTSAKAFVFEGQTRPMFPLRTRAIAEQMERWVYAFVAGECEKLRPDPECKSESAWRVYNDWSERTRTDLIRGDYGAFTSGWKRILITNDSAIAEALYQMVRYQDATWTRDHVKRLMADQEQYRRFYDAYLEENFPLPKAPAAPPGQPPNPNPSTGVTSSGVQSNASGSMPQGQGST